MIGIVGGGISGLFLLHFLRERGLDAMVFEASDEPGGVMRSVMVEGPNGVVPVDLGPQRTRLTSGLAQVVEEVGLTDELLHAPRGIPFTMVHRGRLYPAPTSLMEAARTGLISPVGKLRALADLVTRGPSPDETVAGALRRKLGPEVHARLAGPILGGLYGSDTERMDARDTLLPAFRRAGGKRSFLRALARASGAQGIPVVSFREGMGALPRALSRSHGDRFRAGSPVREITKTSGGGFELILEGERRPVRSVVLTLPAPAAAGVVRPIAGEAADRLETLRYNPLAVVPLVVPPSAKVPHLGSGFKPTLEESFHLRGVTAHDTMFEGRAGLFTAYLGGMGGEDTVELPDEEILELARRDFRTITGADAAPLLVHRTRMPAWDRSWRALDDLELPAGIHLCAAFAERPGIAGRLEDAGRLADRLALEGC